MKTCRHLLPISLCLLTIAMLTGQLRADDWPAWRGPVRDGICREKNLLKEWPKEGPELLWKATGLGIGDSGPAIVGNVLYIMGEKDSKEWVMALDVGQQGKQIWASPLGPMSFDDKSHPGPRATPSIDGDRLYAMGIGGDLVCMDIKDGRTIWHRDLVKEFGGTLPRWGFAESVLVDGPWVVCTPGGAKNTIAAFTKSDGQLVWGSPVGDQAAYASVIAVVIDNVKQYVNLTQTGVIGVAAKDGRFLWRYDAPASTHANCSTCIWSGDTIFASSAYNVGGGLVKIQPSDGGFAAKEVYFTKLMQNHHGNMILLDGFLYGCNNPKVLTCMDFKTGEIKWTDDRSEGKCSLLEADGMLYCRDEKGPISLVEATPEGFKLHGRFNQPDRSESPSWPPLVIANGVMYVRDQDVLLAYDVRVAK
jgi:outer membrane protein assembly factor BamB